MTPNLSIAQAVFSGSSPQQLSPSFDADWIEAAQTLTTGFGSPGTEIAPFAAVFAQPFSSRHVAVVQVSGQAQPGDLQFRFLIMSGELYSFLHDPFAIAERYPPKWNEKGQLPDLLWPTEVLPPRTIKQLAATLKKGDSPFLLGAVQTLVDGAKIALFRTEPQPALIRDLWSLLPDSVRRAAWPSTFAFSDSLGFDVLIMPESSKTSLPGYVTEEQIYDYPASRYEYNLQMALESGDEAELARLLSRKSTSEMIRVALWIMLGMIVLVILAGTLSKL